MHARLLQHCAVQDSHKCWLTDAQAVEALKKLNVPYLVSLPLVFQTTEEWLESELGVHPVQVALQVGELAQPLTMLGELHCT